MIIVVGGAEQFNDKEVALKEIDAILKKLKKSPKDIKFLYGIGTTKVSGEGGYFYAQHWAESHGVNFRDGTPKFKVNGMYNPSAVQERNEALAKAAEAMILFVHGASTGGDSIVKSFEEAEVPIYKVVAAVDKEDLEFSMEVYSSIAKDLVENSVMLDVETTGLSHIKDDVVEIAVVDCKSGKTLYNDFVYTETEVSPHAFDVNGITPLMLEGKPDLVDTWNKVQKKVKNKIIVASNSKFDEKMVCFGLVKVGAEVPSNLWTCLQELYCKYSGQPRKGLNTGRIARQLGIEPGTHKALDDAIAQTKILKAMADKVMPDFSI